MTVLFEVLRNKTMSGEAILSEQVSSCPCYIEGFAKGLHSAFPDNMIVQTVLEQTKKEKDECNSQECSCKTTS